MRPIRFPPLAVASTRRMALAAALVLGVAVAQAVSISPVVLELSPSRRITSVTFSNPGDQPITFQTRTLAWKQVDGVDQYLPTDDLIVAPPIAEIAAGGSQIFRVALRTPATTHEQAYRLVFEDATAAVASSPDEVAIKVRINHDLPVFVSVAGQPTARLRMGPCQGAKASTSACVRLDNAGDRYAQIKVLSIERGSWRKQMSVNARILAGAWRQWELELPVGTAGVVRVSTATPDGVFSTELAAPPR